MGNQSRKARAYGRDQIIVMKHSFLRGLCLLAALLLPLNAFGETAAVTTLPPIEVTYTAPDSDNSRPRSTPVLLYLPSLDGTAFTAVETSLSLQPFRWNLETVLEALFDYGGSLARPLPDSEYLALNTLNPVEAANGIATVNLAASAMNLSHEDLYTVFQSIANTLCQFEEISSVNLLIGGIQPGIDVASQTPAGTLGSNVQDDLATVWARAESQRSTAAGGKKLSLNTTLYYPSYGGLGVLCETRSLVFSASTLPQMARVLLDALYEAPREIHALPLPNLNSFLNGCSVLDIAGERILSLRFSNKVPDALRQSGITLTGLCASLMYTLTTFLPGLAGIQVYIGEQALTSLTPEAGYPGFPTSISLSGGILRRTQFSFALLGECTLYLPGPDGTLYPTRRAIPWYETRSPRFLLEQLMLGSCSYDSVYPLRAPFPREASSGDILGCALPLRGQCLLVNLSSSFLKSCQGLDPQQEKALIYSAVNTLTGLENVNEVCFFIGGEQVDTFGGAIVTRGTFLRNVNILHTAP